MQHASSTLRKIVANTLRREGANAPLLAWPLACGSKIATRTRVLSYADGILTVSVPDQVWRQQLQSFGRQYLAALNQVCAEPVSRIDFVIKQGDC